MIELTLCLLLVPSSQDQKAQDAIGQFRDHVWNLQSSITNARLASEPERNQAWHQALRHKQAAQAQLREAQQALEAGQSDGSIGENTALVMRRILDREKSWLEDAGKAIPSDLPPLPDDPETNKEPHESIWDELDHSSSLAPERMLVSPEINALLHEFADAIEQYAEQYSYKNGPLTMKSSFQKHGCSKDWWK